MSWFDLSWYAEFSKANLVTPRGGGARAGKGRFTATVQLDLIIVDTVMITIRFVSPGYVTLGSVKRWRRCAASASNN